MMEFIEIYLVLGIIILMIVSEAWISSTYKKYSNKTANIELTGIEVTQNMLREKGITDVRIREISGNLEDNYNSKNKVISLSRNSCNRNTVASIAVAAHETGHAIQDNENYLMLRIRKLLAPLTIISSKLVWIVILIGVILQFFNLIVFGLVLMGVTILFQLVTLPVEFDASRRAIKYLETTGCDEETMSGVRTMLKAAAFTYVASTLAALMQMIRLILNLSRDD